MKCKRSIPRGKSNLLFLVKIVNFSLKLYIKRERIFSTLPPKQYFHFSRKWTNFGGGECLPGIPEITPCSKQTRYSRIMLPPSYVGVLLFRTQVRIKITRSFRFSMKIKLCICRQQLNLFYFASKQCKLFVDRNQNGVLTIISEVKYAFYLIMKEFYFLEYWHKIPEHLARCKLDFHQCYARNFLFE